MNDPRTQAYQHIHRSATVKYTRFHLQLLIPVKFMLYNRTSSFESVINDIT